MPLDALDMDQGQYPMTGGLLQEYDLPDESGADVTIRELACTATLIAPDVLLTAAHCVDGWGSMRWSRRVDLQRWAGFDLDDPPQWPHGSMEVVAAVPHPDHESPDDPGLAANADIGLAFLRIPIDARLAWLPTVDEGADLAVGDDVEFAGWGIRSDGEAGLGQWSPSRIASLSDDELEIWSTEDPVRACYGDSGGPTFGWTDDGTPRLIGVHAHGYTDAECASNTGVDTRVDRHLDWIDAEMRRACDDRLRSWCRDPGILPAEANPLVCGCRTGSRPGFLAWIAAAVGLWRRRATRALRRCSPAGEGAPSRRRS